MTAEEKEMMTMSTKEKIKDVAFALFADKGYEATSISNIAAVVGVTKPALYAHYESKEDLFLSIYEELEADYNNCMECLFKEAEEMDIPEKLYHLFEGYLLHFMRNRKKSAFWRRAMFFSPQFLAPEIQARIIKNEQGMLHKLEEILLEGMARGVIRKTMVEDMSSSYYSFRHGCLAFANLFLLNGKFDEHQCTAKIRATWDNYWLGIKEHH